MTTNYNNIADLLVTTQECVVLSGAGISAESGIPTFRTKGGLWDKFDPAVYASIDVFKKDPSKYWLIRGEFIKNYDAYQPNPAHFALADLEKMGIVRHVITQNIDGLHIKAGSRRVTEIHGSLREIHCLQCRREYIAPNVPPGSPPQCECGGVLKPNTVLFGESLPADALERAYREAATCRSMLLIGTSAVVYPAAYLPSLAQQSGATIIEINIEAAWPHADHFIEAKASTAMTGLLAAVKKRWTAAKTDG